LSTLARVELAAMLFLVVASGGVYVLLERSRRARAGSINLQTAPAVVPGSE
jgi:hypothetical protein